MTVATATTIGAGEAARRLGISAQYLGILAASGRIPYIDTPYGRAFDENVVECTRLEREARKHERELSHR
jgi:hypothetical protein